VLIPSLIETEKQLDGLMTILGLNALILIVATAVVVLLQGFEPGSRLQILDINENELATLPLVTLPGLLWRATRVSNPHAIKTAGFFLLMLLAFGTVIMSGSRGSAMSLLIILTVFLIWKSTRRWGYMGFLGIVLGFILVPSIFTTTLDRFMVKDARDTALGGREELWQGAWMLISENPVRGKGIGNSPLEIMYEIGATRYAQAQEREGMPIHNPVLTVWSETGLPGIVLYLGALASAILAFMRRYRSHDQFESQSVSAYYALTASAFISYMMSWIKGGGFETHFTYFLMLSLLLIPSSLHKQGSPQS
jgi:O-antigen ligase